MQTTNNILLIRPSNFIFNNETAASNAFQAKKENETDEAVKGSAINEFDLFAEKLKSKGINVFVFEDTNHPQKPDAIFPNNWVSFHADGTVILYPMYAPNRRHERRMDILESLKKKFTINKILDLSENESENIFLEGTGSIIFDHENKTAFACLSPRTDKTLFIELCSKLHYKPIFFYAHDADGKEIYHTNVMMCIAEAFAVICLDSITDEAEKRLVSNTLISTGHQLIPISFAQLNSFTGNMLALTNKDGKNILVLSQTAFDSLTVNQKKEIEKYCELVPLSIKTIETIGGGSARCMIAEIFLPSLKA